MSTVTFNGVALIKPSLPEFDRNPITNVTVLASGERSVQASNKLGFEVTFTCYTTDYLDIVNLRSLVGNPWTLVIDGDSYTNCYIKAPWRERKINTNPETWRYTVSFVRDTAAL